jgi:hypothetical protein
MELQRIAANIAKLPELINPAVTREAEEDWGVKTKSGGVSREARD